MRLIDEECEKLRKQAEDLASGQYGIPEMDAFMEEVKAAMLGYAIAAQMDSSVRVEIAEESEKWMGHS